MSEYEYEPVPGLPERLPPGEVLLWQGVPRWQSMARHVFHTRTVALYFLALWVLHLVWVLTGGEPISKALTGAVALLVPAAICLGLLVLLAWAMARATMYTVTNRRVVMRFGVAIPIAINLPFTQIVSAALREHSDGSGDIPLAMATRLQTPYLVLWPYARPWYFALPQPMLRAVPEAAKVAALLGDALRAVAAQKAEPTAGAQTGEPPARVASPAAH